MDTFPKERVYYITAEDFTNEMVHALRHDSIGQFKEKYRNRCDVLLLEDIQFLTPFKFYRNEPRHIVWKAAHQTARHQNLDRHSTLPGRQKKVWRTPARCVDNRRSCAP